LPVRPRGPLATGFRLQDCLRLSGPGGAPVELDMTLGKVGETGLWRPAAVAFAALLLLLLLLQPVMV